MEPQEIHGILMQKLPGAEITVEDMTGTRDHFEVIVMWAGFNGKPVMEQHRIVNQALAGPLDEGKIHALKIKTMKTT
ncbi:MAG TPA: BolA/IbaG family iron-sulfur metabolism protein [bacterium]|nr:BolA/IbaG family iron-sulfur metabolism protein [bacterium]